MSLWTCVHMPACGELCGRICLGDRRLYSLSPLVLDSATMVVVQDEYRIITNTTLLVLVIERVYMWRAKLKSHLRLTP